MIELNSIWTGDILEGLRLLSDKSVHCCVTSPPYWNLRDYGVSGQLGLEKTPEGYIAKMVEVFREVKRVLRDDGTLWLNIGDSYAGGSGGSGDKSSKQKTNSGSYFRPSDIKSSTLQGEKKTQSNSLRSHENGQTPGLKPKDLIGIPWMLAFALRADGWYLRSDVIWHKPNPMPESVTDRPTKSHEYLFLLSKSERYYYDYKAIMTESGWDPESSKTPDGWDTGMGAHGSIHKNGREKGHNWNGSSFDSGKTGEMKKTHGHKNLPEGQENLATFRDNQRGSGARKSGNKERKDRPGAPPDNGAHQQGSVPWEGMKANKRTVWTVTTKPFKEAHFATFPQELIVDCIKAGCPIDGIVLDPFMGAGTTAIVARKLNRNYIGIELNPQYVKIAQRRLYKELGAFV